VVEATETEARDQARWYAIQTYSGHENKVKTLIERKIEQTKELSDQKVQLLVFKGLYGFPIIVPSICRKGHRGIEFARQIFF